MKPTSMKSTNDGITLLDHGISKVPDVAINATSNKDVTYLLLVLNFTIT